MPTMSQRILILFLITVASSGAADQELSKQKYEGEIVPFEDNGLFELRGRKFAQDHIFEQIFFRLRGVNVNSVGLEEISSGMKFVCHEVGFVESQNRGIIRIVECENEEIGNLSEALLKTAQSSPVCAEAPNTSLLCNSNSDQGFAHYYQRPSNFGLTYWVEGTVQNIDEAGQVFFEGSSTPLRILGLDELSGLEFNGVVGWKLKCKINTLISNESIHAARCGVIEPFEHRSLPDLLKESPEYR